MYEWKKRMFTRLTLSLIVIMLFSGVFASLSSVSAQGYGTGFEGPKARFYGVDYKVTDTFSNLNGQHFLYASDDRGNMLLDNSLASQKTFDTALAFDGDSDWQGVPKLKGMMTSIYIPKDTLSGGASWLPYNWMTRDQYVTNPILIDGNKIVNWTIGDTVYGMQEWLCHYSVALGAEWSGNVGFFGCDGEIPPAQSGITDNSYKDTNIWIKIDTSPMSYYENAQKTYFAIGKVQLADSINYKGNTLASGGWFSSNVVEPRSTVSINPEGQGALLYIFDSAFGGSSYTEKQAYSYQGQPLNPTLFRDTSYIKISLNRFGVYSGGNYIAGVPVPGSYWVKGDVAKITFDVIVFTIGEWKVQDVQNDPGGFGYFVRSDTNPSDLFSWLLAPSTLAWLIPVLIVVAVIFFAPWILILLISLVRG